MGEIQIESKSQLLTRPRRPALTVKDFKGKADPDWCPGCGDFGVLNALKTAVAELGLLPHEVLTISGIGCSSNLPGYINTYGMHTLHGRALAVASGAQLGNHQLKVVVTGGDGDGFGIGGNHFVHVMRRNVDLTYIVMDNQIYGLTTGQVSPTSRKGMRTKSTPHGSVENPVNPIPMAIVCGATYVARGFSGQQKQLVALIKGAIEHRGFAFVDVFSPCVTYNHDNTHEFFKQRTKKLEEMGHDPSDRNAISGRAAYLLRYADGDYEAVRAELHQEICIGLVGLYLARSRCSRIDITIMARPPLDRVEIFDESVWVTLFSDAAGATTLYPRTLRFSRNSFIYDKERTEFLQIANSRTGRHVVFQPDTSHQEFISMFEKITGAPLTEDAYSALEDRFGSFRRKFAARAGLEG